MNPAGHPEAIAALGTLGDRFVCWRWRTRDGKRTKPPIRPSGAYADSTDPSSWCSLDEALDAAERPGFDGVGFVLDAARDGVVGVDLDGCRDPETGAIAGWATKIINGLLSYTEVSPSGTGVKILARANPVPAFAANKLVIHKANGSGKDQAVEVYTAGRYFCLTGQILPGVPDEITDATEAVERLAHWLGKQAGRAAGEGGGALPESFRKLLAIDDGLRVAWGTGAKLGGGGDASASALDWSLALYLRPHLDDGDIAAVLRLHRHGQIGGGKLRGAAAERRIEKILAELPLPRAAAPDRDEAGHAPQAEHPWPAPLAPEAYHGIVGEIVRLIEPETEADPAALLFQLLAAVGNILGTGAYARVEADRHPPRLFVVQVGQTAKGRKGTSWGRVKAISEAVAPEWASDRVASGLSSGEGVIHEVRDPVIGQETDGKSGRTSTVATDPGVEDKRLLLFEGEFAKALRSMERQGNILSAVLRDAWDHGNLRTIIKNNANRATQAHVSIIGHITDDELRRYLDRTEIANGLANRLVFVCVKRSKLLPRGGRPIDWTPVEGRLRQLLAGAPQGEIGRTDGAWATWEAVYPDLSADRPGLLGAILGRAEAQVLRLALVYALLDRSSVIDAPHLQAALACWDYAEASARFVFGDALGDPDADETLRALRGRPEGLTRNELMNHFGRNLTSERIGRALSVLARGGFVACETVKTQGRPAERWRATR